MRAALALAALLLAAPAVAQTYPMPWAANVQATGIPGISGLPIFLYNAPSDPKSYDARPTLWVGRDTSQSGSGQPWNTYKAIWGLGVAGKNDAGFQWAITGEMHNLSDAKLGAQNVAVNGTIWKEGAGPVGPSWGLNGNCVDLTGEQPPTASCIGAELDVGGAIGPDPNRQRVIMHGAASGQPGAHVGYGVVVSAVPGVTIDRAFSTANVGASFGIGLDLAGASFSGAAVALAPRQWLAFDADANGKYGRFLGFDSGDGLFKYMTPFGPMLTFSDDGAAKVGRLIQTIPHVPASVNAPCETGEQAYDADFFYVCIAPSRWRRAALTDW